MNRFRQSIYKTGWWFGTSILFFHFIDGIIIIPLTFICFKMVIAPPTSCAMRLAVGCTKRDKSSEFSKRPNPVTWKDSEGESSPNGRTIQISEVFKFTRIDISLHIYIYINYVNVYIYIYVCVCAQFYTYNC